MAADVLTSSHFPVLHIPPPVLFVRKPEDALLSLTISLCLDQKKHLPPPAGSHCSDDSDSFSHN